MSCLSVSVFGPDMVLNQRQVLVIFSDWEPYLGSLFCVGFCGWLSPVSVFVPHGTVSGFQVSCFVVYSCLVSSLKNHEL